jgi:hypothetical protein
MDEYLGDPLRSIQNALEKIQQSIDAIAEQNRTAQRDQHVKVQVDPGVNVGLPIEVTEYYRAEQSERGERNSRDKSRLWLERIGLVTAIALVAFTLKTFLVLRGQLQEMGRQTAILRKQADQAAIDASEARGQTEQQISMARDQFRIDQRAWVGMQAVTGNVVPTDNGVTVNTQIQIKNTGKTPAVKMDVRWVNLRRGPKEKILDYDEAMAEVRKLLTEQLRKEEERLKGSPAPPDVANRLRLQMEADVKSIEEPSRENQVLAPDGILTISAMHTFTATEATRDILYLLGKITYNDVFQNQIRTTKFCFMHQGREATFPPCPTGNTMD